ncbi:hypothetical protein D0Z03_000167 [Geotrichum reessii]|nr:hypothetical protein D0Z03_000167 [Galactomyces reessii]
MSTPKEKFEAQFPSIVEELENVLKATKIAPEAIEWYKKANRGLSVIDTYRLLKNKSLEELSEEEYKKAALLGWCVELLQAYFLVADDIMDSSITRRGQPCWYKVPKVGMIAINDAFMLEAAIYILLKNHFKKEAYYIDLVELFHEVTFQTELGQLLDLLTAPEDEVDLNKFSLEKHSYIVTYKTAFYSFYLPVALAMYMAGITSPEDLKQAEDILLPLGEYFQVQDDYLDCYGDPAVIGKIGTDIQDNKCGWVINKALQKANAEQRKVLDENYGVKSAETEAKVKAVFAELNIAQDFLDYEEKIATDLRARIAKVDESRGFKGEVLEIFLNKIYKRQK